MTPYWQSPDGMIRVWNDRWETVVASGAIDVPRVALIHADPPYGGNVSDTRRNGDGAEGERSSAVKAGRFTGGKRRMFKPIEGDDKPFDPRPLLALSRPTVIWGGHLCEPALPRSPSWILWGKREGQTPDDNGDMEMAWSNLGGPVREFQHFWRGALRKTEKVESHLHPTQKPIALSTYVFTRAKLRRGDRVFVPYGGSCPDLPAAVAMGLRVDLCECVKAYCDTGVARLGAVTSEHAAEDPGDLYAIPKVRAVLAFLLWLFTGSVR